MAQLLGYGIGTRDRKVRDSRPDDDATLLGKMWFIGHVKPSVQTALGGREDLTVLTSPR